MWRPFRTACTATIFFALQSSAQKEIRIYESPVDHDEGFFTYPVDYPLTFKVGSPINITWQTVHKDVELLYYAGEGWDTGGKRLAILETDGSEIGSYRWLLYDYVPVNETEPMLLGIAPGPESTGHGAFFTSTFYITKEGVDQSVLSELATSTSASSASSSSATVASSRLTRLASAIPTLPSSSRPSESVSGSSSKVEPPGMDKNTLIGLSVGLTLSSLLTLVGLVFFVLKRRQRRAAKDANPTPPPTGGEEAPETQEYMYMRHSMYAGVSEMESPSSLVELPAMKDSVELPASRHVDAAHAVEEQDEWAQGTRDRVQFRLGKDAGKGHNKAMKITDD